MTGRPLCAATWAIPAPIVPAPTTPTICSAGSPGIPSTDIVDPSSRLRTIVVTFPSPPHFVLADAQVVDRRDQRPGTLDCHQHHRADTLPLRPALLVERDDL